MKNVFKSFSTLPTGTGISPFSISKGFTLIEILMVFALIGLLTISSMAGFSAYSHSQIFKTSVADFVSSLNDARNSALHQVKPAVCGTNTLDGYQIYFPAPGNYYNFSVSCGGVLHLLSKNNLPNNVTFGATSTNTIFFIVASGIVNQQSTITINGYNNTSTIKVNNIGIISVQ